MCGVLDAELDCYRKHLANLLDQAEGKFVLIRGATIAGVFESEEKAIAAGFAGFGPVPFLVKPIARTSERISFGPGHLGR